MKKRKIFLLDYNKEYILERLSLFSNIIDNNKVITKYNDKILSIVDISKRYFNFNFSDFTKNILNKIDNYFEPIKYTFNITKNYQELKIFSHAVDINGELYYKTLSILNSTDKSYALQINIGLVHSKTYATFYIREANEHVSIKNKHFKASLPEIINYFFEAIENLNIILDDQIKFFQKISNKKISLLFFVNEYLKKLDDYGQETNKIIASDILKLRALMYNISINDAKYNLMLNIKQFNTLKSIKYSLQFFKKYLIEEDILIESNVLFILYMEIFKNYNTAINIRESEKILNILKNI